MRIPLFLSTLSVVFILSCSSTSKSHKEAQIDKDTPDWVLQKPFIDGYYVGVGGVKKIGNSDEYSSKAREKALADIAAGISSTISASSVLHKIESQYGSTETFSQYIKVETSEYLEGFEPLHTYQSKDMYWVCYQISKETYLENKNRKKNEAIKASVLNRDIALKNEKNGNITGALKYYIKAFEDLEDYVMEPCFVKYNNNETDLGSFIVDRIAQIIGHIEIQPTEKNIESKRHLILGRRFEFEAKYKSIRLGGIPVSFHYSGGYLREHILFTSKSGTVQCQLSSSSKHVDKAILTAQMAWKKFVDSNTKNITVRRLLKPILSRKSEIEITLLAPTLEFKIIAPQFSDAQKLSYQNKLKAIPGKYRFKMADKDQTPDFIIETIITVKEGEKAGGLISYYAQAELTLKNEQGIILESKKPTKYKGVNSKPNDAKNLAIESCIKSCSNHYIPSMLEDL